jgi:hypothetical protein
MGARRFYMVGSVTVLVIVTVFIALNFSGPSGARPVLGAQSAANMPAGTMPIVPTDKTSDQSQIEDHAKGATHQTGATGMFLSNPHASADTPAFTEQDVRDYVLKYNSRGFFKVDAIGASPQIASIKFAPLSEIEADQDSSLGIRLSPDTLLCSVTYDGNFVVSAPFAEAHFSHAAQFFDAHTGEVMAETAFNDK